MGNPATDDCGHASGRQFRGRVDFNQPQGNVVPQHWRSNQVTMNIYDGIVGQRTTLLAHAAKVDATGPLADAIAFNEGNCQAALAQVKGDRSADDAAAKDQGVHPFRPLRDFCIAHSEPTGSGFTGGWLRRRPTSAISPLRIAARISAAAAPQIRP